MIDNNVIRLAFYRELIETEALHKFLDAIQHLDLDEVEMIMPDSGSTPRPKLPPAQVLSFNKLGSK